MESPNPLRAAWSMVRARRVTAPGGSGMGRVDHEGFVPVLGALARSGTPALTQVGAELGGYLRLLTAVDPISLSRSEALAFWLNLYNAGALKLAARALAAGAGSVLRVPGAFDAPMLDVGGERLSLDDIEHGKVRRFGDPRIHAALVCGSVSCPTLRFEPFTGDRLDDQLDDQMRNFLAQGGAKPDDESRTVRLARVFLWFGGDFTRPHRMPTWIPARPRSLVRELAAWMEDVPEWLAEPSTSVEYQSYDWGLGCSVG